MHPSLRPGRALIPRDVRQRRLLVDAVILGIAAAACAWVFNLLLGFVSVSLLEGLVGYRPPGLPSEGGVAAELVGPQGLWLIPLVTTAGGLLVGLITPPASLRRPRDTARTRRFVPSTASAERCAGGSHP